MFNKRKSSFDQGLYHWKENVKNERMLNLNDILDPPARKKRSSFHTWVVASFIFVATYCYFGSNYYEVYNKDSSTSVVHKGLKNAGRSAATVHNGNNTDDIDPEVELKLISLWDALVPNAFRLDGVKSKCAKKKSIYIPPKATIKPKITMPMCDHNVRQEKILEEAMTNATIATSLDDVFPMVTKGGYYKPKYCHSTDSVAILVPYRNRQINLMMFLLNIHPFLMAQNLEYRIFVIEQYGDSIFNKGRLFNAGFKEMKRFGMWRCVVLHDVDLLPMSPRILYTCPDYPRHMSSLVHSKGPQKNGVVKNTSSAILFGGVTSMLVNDYERANGHSNRYWGWGGEDYDIYWRLRASGLKVVRYNKNVGQYLALPHVRGEPNPLRYRLLKSALAWRECDGLNSVQYRVQSVSMHYLYTHVLVDVNNPKDPLEANMRPLFKKLR